jgi:hypothetical protein
MRTRPWGLTIGLIGTFPLPIIAAGHGAAPVGYLLAVGWVGWTVPVLLGWSAIVLLVGGLLTPARAGWILMWLGAAASLASWALFAAQSETLLLTVPTSVPYLACLAAWARRAERPWRLG